MINRTLGHVAISRVSTIVTLDSFDKLEGFGVKGVINLPLGKTKCENIAYFLLRLSGITTDRVLPQVV